MTELWDDLVPEPKTDAAKAFSESTEDAPIPGAAVGYTKKGKSFRLFVLARDLKQADTIKSYAPKETDIVYTPKVPKARATAQFFQRTQKVLVSGSQISPLGMPWVGTGSLPVPSAEDPNVLLWMTNNHVAAGVNKLLPGHVINQGNKAIGSLYRYVPISFTATNMTDAASIKLRNVDVLTRWSHVFDSDIKGIRSTQPEDMNQEVGNDGRTIGSQKGEYIAMGVKGQPVAYDNGIAYFNNVTVATKPGGGDFSQGGHSGASMIAGRDLHATNLLFAGGPDHTGRDLTFGVDMPYAIRSCGGLVKLV